MFFRAACDRAFTKSHHSASGGQVSGLCDQKERNNCWRNTRAELKPANGQNKTNKGNRSSKSATKIMFVSIFRSKIAIKLPNQSNVVFFNHIKGLNMFYHVEI